jgi:hypothetical protein
MPDEQCKLCPEVCASQLMSSSHITERSQFLLRGAAACTRSLNLVPAAHEQQTLCQMSASIGAADTNSACVVHKHHLISLLTGAAAFAYLHEHLNKLARWQQRTCCITVLPASVAEALQSKRTHHRSCPVLRFSHHKQAGHCIHPLQVMWRHETYVSIIMTAGVQEPSLLPAVAWA